MSLKAKLLQAQAKLQAGDPDAALTILAPLLRAQAGVRKLRALAERTVLALLERGDLDAAHRLFQDLPGVSDRIRYRLVLALVNAGRLREAADAAGRLARQNLRSRVFGRALRRLRERPAEAAQLLLATVPEKVAPAVLRNALDKLARVGEHDAARRLLARFPATDAAELALHEATVLHREGRIEEARQRIAPFVAAAAVGSPLFDAAMSWARRMLDFDNAVAMAERLATADAEVTVPKHDVAAAKLLADQGRHGPAWQAVRRVRHAFSALEQRRDTLSDAERTQAAMAALAFADLAAARRLVQPLPPQNIWRRRAQAAAWTCGRHPPTGVFMERAARAWADPDAALRAAMAADIAIVCPARMLPLTGFGLWPDGTAVPIGEEGVCHRVLVRTMQLAEQAGLRVALVPSPGFSVPPALIERRRFFVSYHSVSVPAFGVHVKAGPLPDTLLLDPTGYSGWASLCTRPLDDLPLGGIPDADAAAWRERELSRLASRNISKWEQRPREAAVLPAGPAVLVALQIPSDTAMRHAWVDMYELARAVVRGFRGTGVTVLLKRHPRCKDPRTDRILRELRAEPGVAVTDASVHDLLPVVRAVYCINSGLGAEALLYGRAVHVAGLTDYRHACHEVRTLDELRTDESAFTPPLPPDALCRYVYWYRNIHHVPLDQPGALDAAIRTRILDPAAGSTD